MPRRADPLTQLRARLAAQQLAQAAAPLIARQEAIARVLDGLNAWEALEKARRHFPAGMCFGPGTYSGGRADWAWVGVLIWRRAPGYYGYKTLTLYGVWAESALVEDAPISVRVGVRAIPYTSDFYTAEAWFTLMRDRFDDYYDDDGHPPEDAPILFTLDRAQRLAQRSALAEAIVMLVRGK